jgi:glucose/arabinose dehydrogenase
MGAFPLLSGFLALCTVSVLLLQPSQLNAQVVVPAGYMVEVYADTGLTTPAGLAFDAQGNLFVANIITGAGGHTATDGYVSKVTPAGVVSTVATGLAQPVDLAFDAAGNLYVSNHAGNVCCNPGATGTVSKLEFLAGGGVSVSTFAAGFQGTSGIAFDSQGNLFVVESQFLPKGGIKKVTPAGVVSSFISLDIPDFVVIDSSDNLFVSTQNTLRIDKITPAGVLTPFQVLGSGCPTALSGMPMAFDNSGDLLVACIQTGNLFKITPSGSISTFATGFDAPIGLAVDVDGSIYVSNAGDDSILKISPETFDSDGDGVPDAEDLCPGGDDNIDTDVDGVPDSCDACPLDFFNDSDGDSVCDSDDLCLGDDLSGDSDADGLCDDSDPCIGASNSDSDGDGVCNEGDLCFGDDASGNTDGDGVCDDLDACEGDDASGDTDLDLFCDDVDVCPLDPENDAEGDGICESDDNCPLVANSGQSDLDENGVGDACDPDIDGDGVPNGDDNCEFDVNVNQTDTDGDGAGDACDDDLDGDGVLDEGDACVPSPVGEVVDATGCAISELCPCEHPLGGDRWKNHGAYVSCVAHASEDLMEAGLITEAEKDTLVSTAAESTCGHKNK